MDELVQQLIVGAPNLLALASCLMWALKRVERLEDALMRCRCRADEDENTR